MTKVEYMLDSYLGLRKRVDRFVESVGARYGEQIVCRARCADCCVDGLSVCLVEAVNIGRSLGIIDEMIHLQAGQPPQKTSTGKCAFLSEDGLCTIYAERPLVCRTHGFPIKMEDAGEISVCEKNFTYQTPHHSAVLDQQALDTTIFAVNLDYCSRAGVNPLARVGLERICDLALAKRATKNDESC